jgi:hypothetical protein
MEVIAEIRKGKVVHANKFVPQWAKPIIAKAQAAKSSQQLTAKELKSIEEVREMYKTKRPKS